MTDDIRIGPVWVDYDPEVHRHLSWVSTKEYGIVAILNDHSLVDGWRLQVVPDLCWRRGGWTAIVTAVRGVPCPLT